MNSSTKYSNQFFEPNLQVLHEEMDPILDMLLQISEAKNVFLNLWDHDYFNVVGENGSNIYQDIYLKEFRALKCRLDLVNPEVIYITDSRFHTLFLNNSFFKDYSQHPQWMILPLVGANDKRIGLVGINLCESKKWNFGIEVNQLEAIGKHIAQKYNRSIGRSTKADTHRINLNDLPVSFFNFSINEQAELLNCEFSKTLIRKQQIFNNSNSSLNEIIQSILKIDRKELLERFKETEEEQIMEYVYPYSGVNMEKKVCLVKMRITRLKGGVFQCLGLLEDVSIYRTYSSALDQMIFDISHVMRRPIVSMKGLTNLINLQEFDRLELHEIVEKIKIVSDEMEEYVKAMFKIYEAKQYELNAGRLV